MSSSCWAAANQASTSPGPSPKTEGERSSLSIPVVIAQIALLSENSNTNATLLNALESERTLKRATTLAEAREAERAGADAIVA
jgi:hypothetical protein